MRRAINRATWRGWRRCRWGGLANNHHAFPTSAYHGLSRRQFDPSALVIRTLEDFGLAWDVVRVSPERRAAKATAA